jgi:CBS domain-containing protein
MHRLRDVFRRRHLVSAAPLTSVLDVALLMTERGVGAIPIVDGERLVGVFSERDLMTRIVVPGRDPARTPVGEVMTREVITATLDEPAEACRDKMQRAGCRHLPVLVDGKVVSMLSMRDLLRVEIAVQDEEIRSLRAYLHQVPPQP